MMFEITLIIGLILLFLVALFVIFLFKRIGTTVKLDPNASIILNFMNNRSNGFFLGTETDSLKGIEGREKVYYFPADVRKTDRLTEKDEDIKIQDVISAREHLFTFAPGELSKRRTVKMVLPKHIDELNSRLAKTTIGIGFINAIKLKNFENDVIKALKEGGIARAKWLIENKQGEISAQEMRLIQEKGELIVNQYLKEQKKEEKER